MADSPVMGKILTCHGFSVVYLVAGKVVRINKEHVLVK